MDIEDLFNEKLQTFEESKTQPMVIPEFDPCSGEGKQVSTSGQKGNKCCKTDKSLTCSSLTEQDGLTGDAKKAADKVLVQEGKVCFKCKVNPPSYSSKQDKICKTCFLEINVHRFKSSLRQNLKIWKDDLNLICISGGSYSMSLLNMMYQSLFGNTSNRKMFFRVHVLHIDEGRAVYNWSPEEHQKNIELIKNTCDKYQFTYTVVPLEAVYDIDEQIDLKNLSPEEAQLITDEKKNDEQTHSVPTNLDQVQNKIIEVKEIESKRKRLQSLIESLPTTSSFREDLILYLKKWLIVDFAFKYNFKKIMLGTNGHKVATQLLAQLAKGRGTSIPHEISYVDDKNFGGRITFMNPMREFLQKEVSLYNYLSKVEIIQQKPLAYLNNPNINAPAFGSTDHLIEKFFNKLQDKYNVNTVPTVVRLTNKLLKGEIEGKYPFCPLCFGVRDTINNLLEMGSTIKSVIIKEDGKNEVQTIKSSSEWLCSELEQAFCFGCKRMAISALQNDAFIELLPSVVLENCKKTLAE